MGVFLDINSFYVPIPMLVWVMRHMIVGVSQFKCGNNSIKFDKDIVRKVIGLPQVKLKYLMTVLMRIYVKKLSQYGVAILLKNQNAVFLLLSRCVLLNIMKRLS